MTFIALRTHADLLAWCAGVVGEYGESDASCGQLYVRYQELPSDSLDGLITASYRLDTLDMHVAGEVLRLKIEKEPRMNAEGEITHFAIEKVTEGLWSLGPSLNIPGLFHVFITLYDVPNPAPWERLITLIE